jgi:TrbL/VirB6 plasmid conjugal transfer protein
VKRVLLLAVGLVFLAWPSAAGEYRGSDLLGNVAPESQVAGGLADEYPLSAYALDYHVDVGVTEPEGVPPMIAQWAAAQLWSATSFLVKTTIDLFTWAFSLDLLNGNGGALAPIGDAITGLYENVIGESWMVAAILIAGIWGIWKALVQRRYTETAGALGMSVVFVLIALFFVYQPERTIGQASKWTNTLSLAFLSGANRGSLDDPQQAKRQVSDHLFETLVYQPWVVLQFGGLSHCVDTDRLDEDGFPRPVSPHDSARDVCRDHMEQGRDGYGGYAPRYLRQAPGSEERKAEYDALREGDAPVDRQFAGYRVDKADAPAVDAQQAGGAFQRLTFAVIVLLGALGAIALLGFLSLAVILAQVVALVLLGFAPVALIIGIFPGAGHDFFRGWLTKLATAVFIKALYSLVIAVVVAVSAALTASTGSLGFLFAFGLQTIFFWAIFIYRKQITNRLVSATTGSAGDARMPKMTVVQKGAQAATRPFSALAGVARGSSGKQESAIAGGGSTASGASSSADGSSSATGDASTPPATKGIGRFTRKSGAKPLDGGAPPSTNGAAPASSGSGATGAPPSTNGAAPGSNGSGAAASNGSNGVSDTPRLVPAASASSNGHDAPPSPTGGDERAEQTPRASHEDVMRRARQLRDRQREALHDRPDG